jgi:hypothetical protein
MQSLEGLVISFAKQFFNFFFGLRSFFWTLLPSVRAFLSTDLITFVVVIDTYYYRDKTRGFGISRALFTLFNGLSCYLVFLSFKIVLCYQNWRLYKTFLFVVVSNNNSITITILIIVTKSFQFSNCNYEVYKLINPEIKTKLPLWNMRMVCDYDDNNDGCNLW